jgi:acetate kinase
VNILVFNAGSSSVKFSLIDPSGYHFSARGMIERIGMESPFLLCKNIHGHEWSERVGVKSIFEAVEMIIGFLIDPKNRIIHDKSAIYAVGHRVVHGGENDLGSVLINEETKEIIKKNVPLAPLHNPPNLEGIEACEALLPDIPQVAIFDTAFHATLPDYAYLYAVPYEFYEKYHIRRYGFHGISHKYVAEEAAQHLKHDFDKFSCISCHLGNGCSITATKDGKSRDTSMGMTPLEGLIMGTRSGDIDPSIVEYLLDNTSMDYKEIFHYLNKKSGLYGLSGYQFSDMRDISSAYVKGDRKAILCLDAFCYRVKKYIGSYLAALNGTDCLIFTGGIGENSPIVREKICCNLSSLGIQLDYSANESASSKNIHSIHSEFSPTKILVIPTNEEKEISRKVESILNDK